MNTRALTAHLRTCARPPVARISVDPLLAPVTRSCLLFVKYGAGCPYYVRVWRPIATVQTSRHGRRVVGWVTRDMARHSDAAQPASPGSGFHTLALSARTPCLRPCPSARLHPHSPGRLSLRPLSLRRA